MVAFPSFSLTFLFNPFFLYFPSHSFLSPLGSRTHDEIQLGDLGERCKLPQWAVGRNPSRSRILSNMTPSATILIIF